METHVLEVNNLRTHLFTERGIVKAVDGITFHVNRGEIFGLVGESGCGKSITALSIMKLVPSPPGRIVSGEIFVNGQDVIKASENEMRQIRGKEVSMIFQDPVTSLNPIMRVGDQISETVRNQLNTTKEKARETAIDLLKSVGIPDAPTRALLYPFQMSGGMQQRVMIALALSCSPKLLIADEPTTNLDVTIQAQVLELIRGICKEYQTSVMLITHSMGIVAWLCNRLAVMYAGRIVEIGATKQVFGNPLHPYTRALLKAIPRATSTTEDLSPIAGDVPNLITMPSGCPFNPRCEFARDTCKMKEPVLTEHEPGHYVSCHMYSTNEWEIK